MSVDGFSFDLSAAQWRKGATDERAMAEALAVRLEQALPGKTIVERHHGLFSKETPLRKIVVSFEDVQFQLSYDKRDGIRTAKAQVGRGIVLKTIPLEFGAWLEALSLELKAFADKHTDMRDTLQQFLFS